MILNIKKICLERNIILIEDNCESLGTELPEGKAGNFSLGASFSFFVAHHMSTIEGGMVCTDDEEFAEMLRIVRANGWDRNLTAKQQYKWRQKYNIQSEFDAKYTFYDLGFNFRLTEIQAVLGISQLKRLETFLSKRAKLVESYKMLLEFKSQIAPAQVCAISGSSNHIFPIRIKFSSETKSRNQIMLNLKQHGIGSQVHYIPIPVQPYYSELGYSIADIPEAFSYYEEALTIPLFPRLKKRQQKRIIDILEKSI